MNAKTIQNIDKIFKSSALGNGEYEFYSPFKAPFEISGLPWIKENKCDCDNDLRTSEERRVIIRKTWENAISEGDKNVYFLDGKRLFGNFNRDSCTVDGCHPNDLGFMRMAEMFISTIEDILT